MAARVASSKHFSSFLFSSKVTSFSPAYYSTNIVGESPVLVRDFIHAALYDPEHGYFLKDRAQLECLIEALSSVSSKINQMCSMENLLDVKGEMVGLICGSQMSLKRGSQRKFQSLRIWPRSTLKVLLSLKHWLVSFPDEDAFKVLLIHQCFCVELEDTASMKHKFCRKAYVKHLDAIYKQSDISWFTPVELFKPWYAHGIAEAIMRTANLSVPLKIYEIGGGSGTCAKGVMDYMKLNAPTRVYDNMTYVSVEISSSLAKKQLETVGEVDSHLAKFRVECRDAADPNGWGHEQQPCWVIMLEVLDNLPHDLIFSKNQVASWMEVWVEKRHDRAEPCELYKPLEDPLIASCMEILDLAKDGSTRGTMAGSFAKSTWAKILPKPRRCWLPTGCLKLLQVLHGALPKMSLIASDFSYLPDVRIPGERAPLVASKLKGSSLVQLDALIDVHHPKLACPSSLLTFCGSLTI
ncbi:hypothetical protein DH2020_043472 [Rehmannia glutinosa]|uniref:Protein arginine methyltransferase NDUFAF7 n=1 Tax=Rehmannia glutinosa TaxID=99300 RepID=A0ABR0UKF4_REHGL